jgi:hypothetical protein
VPLLIHLVRRLQLIDTEFAALRWISSRAQPRRRVRFERPWLLLIRLALLALLALLLARLVSLAPSADTSADWIAVAPGADLGAARTRIGTGSEWHWLAPGFPRIDANAALLRRRPRACCANSTRACLRAACCVSSCPKRSAASTASARISRTRSIGSSCLGNRRPHPTPHESPSCFTCVTPTMKRTRSRTCAAPSRRGTCASRTATRSTRSP